MSWQAAYRAYDDDTLVALANAGLLRRAAKDLEAGAIRWLEQQDAGGTVEVDGQQVRLDARGPQQARCDCPAPGVCRHILAASLWLRALPPAEAATQTEAAPTPRPEVDPLAEILALPDAALLKAAGKAAMRRAAAMAIRGVEWRTQGGALVIDLPELGTTCRWIAGAGFAGMVSELPAGERKAIHLLALALLRQAHGQAPPWPTQVEEQEPSRQATRLGERERDFIGQVESMLHELIDGGLAHIGMQASARLLALNMSARGEGLPRLAALLRNLGGTIDLLIRRDHRAEERDALALMGRIQALCDALREADDAELAGLLRGRLQRDFQTSDEALELLPLGACWWHTRGGARGLTLAVWDMAGARLLQATLARPDGSDTSFTRRSAWSAQALWSGAGAAQRSCEAVLHLERPRLADDGRLALGGSTQARTEALWKAEDARLHGVGCADWAELGEMLRNATGLAGEPVDMLLLRPAATHPPSLDEAQQRLDWYVQDRRQRWLRLSVDASDEQQLRMENLNHLCARRMPVRAVLVRVERADADTTLTPVAILSENEEGRLQVVSLDFAQIPPQGPSLAQRILRLLETRRQRRQLPVASRGGLGHRLLAPLLGALETQAATGRRQPAETQLQQLQETLRQLRATGIDAIAARLAAYLHAPGPAPLLRLAFVSLLAMEFDGLPSSDQHLSLQKDSA